MKSLVEKQKRPVLKMKDDIMFKALFSRKENEGFLKDLLEAILGKEIKIKRVIHDARLEQLAKEQKYGILDLDIELENGEILNVEMQLKNNHNIDERTVFYASKKIVEQMEPGMKYNKTNKSMDSISRHGEGELLEMAKKENKRVAKAVENYEVLTGDAEVKRLAEIRLMSELEEQSALATARAKGEEIGLKQGEKIGRQILNINIPIEQIAKITNLSENEIKKLQ